MSEMMLYDSQTAFQGGMQGGVDPSLVADHQYSRGINVSCREGIIDVRPSFDRINVDTSKLIPSADKYEKYKVIYDESVVILDSLRAIENAKRIEVLAAFNASKQLSESISSNALINSISNHYSITLSSDTVYHFLLYISGKNALGTGLFDLGIKIQGLLENNPDYYGTGGDRVDINVMQKKDPWDFSINYWQYQLQIELFFKDPVIDLAGGSDFYNDYISVLLNLSDVVVSDSNIQAWMDCYEAIDLLLTIVNDNGDLFNLNNELSTAVSNTRAQKLIVNNNLITLESIADYQEVYKKGKFQGSYIYKTTNRNYIVEVINGHVFLVNLITKKVTGITDNSTKLNGIVDRCYFVQAEGYLIIQDGISNARILEGATIRIADPSVPEIPTGTNMAYGHGRVAIQVSPRHFVMGDIFLAYEADNVLKMKESEFLNEGGGFTVSARLGDIISMQLAKVADTSTGDGPLLVICENGFASYSINNPRGQWNNIDIAKVQLFGSGVVGNNALCHIGEDILYRSHEGIRSYQVGKRESAQGYKYTELSKEVERYIQNDMQYNGKFIDMEFFDKRMLSLTTPKGIKTRSNGYSSIEDRYNIAKSNALAIDPLVTDINIYSKYIEKLNYIFMNTFVWGNKEKEDGGIYANWLKSTSANPTSIEFLPENTPIPQDFTVHLDFFYEGADVDSGLAGHSPYLGDYSGWNIGVIGSTDNLNYDQISVSINGNASSHGFVTTGEKLNVNTRNQVTMTYDSTSKTVKMLMNGETFSDTDATIVMGLAGGPGYDIRAYLNQGSEGVWNGSLKGHIYKFLYYEGSMSDLELADLHDIEKPYPEESETLTLITDIEPRVINETQTIFTAEGIPESTEGYSSIIDRTGNWVPLIKSNASGKSPEYFEDTDWIWYRNQIASIHENPIDKDDRIKKLFSKGLSDQIIDSDHANIFLEFYNANNAYKASFLDDTFFKGIISFDFSLAGYTKSTQDSQYSRVTTGSYDGIWTGINTTSLLVTVIDGVKKCYATTKSFNEVDGSWENTIYEITRRQDGYDNNRSKKIESILDTKAFAYKTEQTYVEAPFVYKKLEDMTFWVTGVSEEVNIDIYCSPDVLNKFYKIGSLRLLSNTSSSGDPRLIGSAQSRAMIPLWDMPNTIDDTTKKLIRLGNEFTFRIIWTGKVRIRRFFSAARKIAQDRQNNIETEETVYPIDKFDQYRYSSE